MKKRINKLTLVSLATNMILLIVVLSLIFTDVNDPVQNEDRERRRGSILVHFDDQDLEQLDDLVTGFHEGRGKYMMLIPPIIDGGHVIYDIRSDGETIKWSVDNTRDHYSSAREVKTYECKSIHKDETEARYMIQLSQCEGYDPDEKVAGIAIWKGMRPKDTVEEEGSETAR